jgi:hypothetical protein
MVRFGKPDSPVLTENSRTSGQCNKCFKVALDKYMRKNESTKRQSKDKTSRIKHQTWYTCRNKGHLVRIVLKLKLLFIKLSMIIYLTWSPRITLALSRWLVHLVIALVPFGYQNTCWLTLKDPIMLGYQNLLDQVVGSLRYIGSLTINKKVESLLYCQAYESLCKYWSNATSRTR